MLGKSQQAAAKQPEAPRYRLKEKAFMSGVRVQRNGEWISLDDVLLDPEEQPMANRLAGPYDGREGVERMPLIIEYDGIPGGHMEPLNDAAIAMFEKHKNKILGNPIDALSIVGVL